MLKFSIHSELSRRILVLDGAMGTMIQRHGLTEADFRGIGNTLCNDTCREFADHPIPLKGCNDVLALTQPEVISGIHEAYLAVGADIISTDSFNANAISMAEYGLEPRVYEMNRAAARLAREKADEFTLRNPSKPRFVAGSMGPTNRTAALSANVDDPAARDVTFTRLAESYHEQARGLLDGGADILLIETVFDTLNAKAALFAVSRLQSERGTDIPVMVSGTIADTSGRILSGQTVEAFYTSLAHGNLLSIGLNCAFGARQMRPYLERLAAVAECRISTHPNAGLPNLSGGYDETPEMFALDVEEYLRAGMVNIVGGCCGTTPEHTRLVAQAAAKYTPRPLPQKRHITTLAGLEPLAVTPESNFINIGERANVAGSAKFARLIRENRYEEAITLARDQVEAGAQVVDVCMDDGMIEGEEAMTRFLLMAAAEPELARVPFMVDSSSWNVLEAGLRCTQGKSIVNSISLKEGEEEFMRRAGLIRRYGAAAAVMLFDERGQADTYPRKTEVAERAYKLLTDNGFPPEDIIFDPNVLTIATGIPEHDNYAVDFIEATRWIKQNLPHAKVSAGVSNLSFAFRGNNTVREAMHSVFLYHAIAAGLDMGLVNAGMIRVYSDIEPRLLELVEDAVLNRRPDATERLAAYAEEIKSEEAGARAGSSAAQTTQTSNAPQPDQWREKPLAERIAYAVLKGTDAHIASDALEAYRELGSPLKVIDTLLMPAMGTVGELFGAGKMFLPQVVKSARVMRRAVDALQPYIEGEDGMAKSSGKLLMATVRGDVHDIGKNIVSVVAQCNGYEVIDLGVMVEAERIADEAQKQGADAVGLSGLITPSLDEMVRVVRELGRRGLRIPVLIGGATTSPLHTAVKIVPEYSGVVVHSRDASDGVRILTALSGSESETFIREVKASQQTLREHHIATAGNRTTLPIVEARLNRYKKPSDTIALPQHVGRIVFTDHSIAEVEPYINWSMFYAAWQVRGEENKKQLRADAEELLSRIKAEHLLRLEGVAGVFPATRHGDDIVVTDPKGNEIRLPQLRDQTPGQALNLSVADYVYDPKTEINDPKIDTTPDPKTDTPTDFICAFALTAGTGLRALTETFHSTGDEYGAIMAKLLADRLTEAFAETVHEFVRRVAWGYQTQTVPPQDAIHGKYRGVRYAMGYPATPDHSLKRELFELLGVEKTTSMRLTENYMIDPGEALCGIMVADTAARFFDVAVGDDQLQDYALRRGKTPDEIKKLISKI